MNQTQGRFNPTVNDGTTLTLPSLEGRKQNNRRFAYLPHQEQLLLRESTCVEGGGGGGGGANGVRFLFGKPRVHKSNEDKIMILDSHKLVAASGEPGDRVQFMEYIQKNVALYQFRHGIPLTTASTANFTRGELATALRKNPYAVNILLAGYDDKTGPSLYYIDYIATLHKVEKGAFGYGSYFALSMMDRHYHSGMSLGEAMDLVDKCILEIRSSLVVAPPNFVIKTVDKDGAR